MSDPNADTKADGSDCPFCAIIRGDRPALIARRWTDAIAFAPLNPATPGHTLVVPAVHYPTIWDVDPEVIAGIGRHVLDVATNLRDLLEPDGLNIIQSNGVAATQTVAHIHIHLVPRYQGDNMGKIWPSKSEVVDISRTEQIVTALAAILK